jgi:hypothetical protein
MRALLELLMGAQSRGLQLMERLAARQLGARDLLFWAAAAALPALFVGALDIKLGLLGLVTAGFAAECVLGLSGLRGSRPSGHLPWAGGAAWALRGLMIAGAAAFVGWRLHARGQAHRELVREVKALRATLEQVGTWLAAGCAGGRSLRGGSTLGVCKWNQPHITTRLMPPCIPTERL